MHDRRRVLVLGVNGFIGRHVRDALETHGDEVLGLAGPRSAAVRPWRAVDLVADDLTGLLSDAAPDVVVNCAGRTHGSPAALASANVTVVTRLLEALARQPAPFIHLGSAAEYGPGVPDRPTSEADEARPTSAYGATKLEATDLVRESGLGATVLRIFNPVGAGMAPDSMPGIAAARIGKALERGYETISMGDLSASRDFVGVRDVAAAVVAACHRDRLPKVLNVGSGRATAARDLVTTLATVAGFNGTVREKGAASARSGAVDYQCADIGLARRHLGWEPIQSLTDSVAELWAGVHLPSIRANQASASAVAASSSTLASRAASRERS